jgi:hypothetical protein
MKREDERKRHYTPLLRAVMSYFRVERSGEEWKSEHVIFHAPWLHAPPFAGPVALVCQVVSDVAAKGGICKPGLGFCTNVFIPFPPLPLPF